MKILCFTKWKVLLESFFPQVEISNVVTKASLDILSYLKIKKRRSPYLDKEKKNSNKVRLGGEI